MIGCSLPSYTSPQVCSVGENISLALLKVLGTNITRDDPLMSSGLDSIASTEFVTEIAGLTATDLPQTLLFDHPTIRAITQFILEKIPKGRSNTVRAGALGYDGPWDEPRMACPLAATDMKHSLSSVCFTLPGLHTSSAFKYLTAHGCTTNSTV